MVILKNEKSEWNFRSEAENGCYSVSNSNYLFSP